MKGEFRPLSDHTHKHLSHQSEEITRPFDRRVVVGGTTGNSTFDFDAEFETWAPNGEGLLMSMIG